MWIYSYPGPTAMPEEERKIMTFTNRIADADKLRMEFREWSSVDMIHNYFLTGDK
jgi:hypothetical protein